MRKGLRRVRPFRARRGRIVFWTLIAALGVIVCAVLFVVAVNLLIVNEANPYLVDNPETAPSAPVAIVLGAPILRDGTPSPMLADRLDAAFHLYRDGKVKSLLLTGNGLSQNGVMPMRSYLIERGVPEDDLLLDIEGFTTYDSVVRAERIFQITEALIPTQGFHLSRAVYLARSVGISAIGVPADMREYSTVFSTVREWGARVKAFLVVHF